MKEQKETVDQDTIDNVPLKELWKKRVRELVKKKIIDTSQSLNLIKMIESSDNENFTVVREIIRTHMRGPFAEGLNQGQIRAFDDIMDFINDPQHDAFVLKGYAGTGKTFLVKRVINYLMHVHPKHKIAITAPTNKAVQVLYMSSSQSTNVAQPSLFEDLFDSESRLMYSTIHKLLRYKEVISPDGKLTFQPDVSGKGRLDIYNYLIIDEVSMLDDKLCRDIMRFSKNIRIIFMGDPAQIPPVHKEDCIPFRDSQTEFKFKMAELTEIMRQKGEHAVVDTSFHIRRNLLMTQPVTMLRTKLNAKGHGIVYLDSRTEKPKVKPLLTELFTSKEFKEDANHAKVIAWKNATVGYMNGVVRELLYGENPDTFMKGEKLLANKLVSYKGIGYNRKGHPYERWTIGFYTSEEMTVEDVVVDEMYFNEGMYHADLKAYSLTVSGYDPINEFNKRFPITVIHPDSMDAYNKLLEEAKKAAKDAKDPDLWRVFYNMKKWNANLTYNYAITAHKSQGSTYKNVLLIEDDLDANPKTIERNRIKYTSYSRASDVLYILRKNPEL